MSNEIDVSGLNIVLMRGDLKMCRHGFYGGSCFGTVPFSREDYLHGLEMYKADLEYELKKVNEKIKKIKKE